MDPASNIWREIIGLEDELSDHHCAGRKAKKSRLEKLRRDYRSAGNGYPRTSDSTWHPGDEI
jgi:hypothetical protein